MMALSKRFLGPIAAAFLLTGAAFFGTADGARGSDLCNEVC